MDEGRAGMNREEAIAIIRKEYLCVDRDCDIERNCGKCDLMMPSKEPILEAYRMAIKALEQEPCGNAIDRAEAIKIASGYCHPANIANELAKLPPVNPQPCEEAISRQAVLDALYALCDTGETLKENPWRDNPYIDAVIETIEELPSVTPQPQTGYWEWMTEDKYRCSNCNYETRVDECMNKPMYDFCPFCGVKMVQESEEV